ncbi:MAG TPA: chalcone isomerase family protein, partial [Thermoanaerobaculia bacterium]
MRIYATALLAALTLALPANAGTLAGVTLPDKADAGGQTLVLNGLGLRTKFFIKVYVGGLYLPQKEKSAAKVLSEDVPRRMVMHFLYSVSKDQMCDAWKEGLEQNSPKAAADVKKEFQTLCSWMEPIPKGHELVLTY